MIKKIKKLKNKIKKKYLNFVSKRFISPLIATILLVVVLVALILIVLVWGKAFTHKGVDSTNESKADVFTVSDVSFYITKPDVVGQNLFINYRPPGEYRNKTFTVIGYSVYELDEIIYFDENVILKEGIIKFEGINLPSNSNKSKVDLKLYTTKGEIIYLDNIPINKYIPPTLPNLSFSEESGEFSNPINVSIDSNIEDVDIYYTLNGSTPDSTKTLYNSPINVEESLTLKAISYKEGYLESDVVSVDYVILELPNIPYYSGKLYIHPISSNAMIWIDAVNYCSNLVAYGYSDWYLPTSNELQIMSDQRNNIDFGTYEDVWQSYAYNHIWARNQANATDGYLYYMSNIPPRYWQYPKTAGGQARCVKYS
ncbi:MAG: chitobiase/beta-hexosaminidase C-terminal domain-containing protein [Candidatus ainarchaeum sp.]|nr:chitobiase/beta-hexosaminidase C-terminal domain-containing protein [Candidatus ainarchaeum sp.]